MKDKKWALVPLIMLIAGLAAYHFLTSPKNQVKQVVTLERNKPDCSPVASVCEATNKEHGVTLHFPEKVTYLEPFKMRVTVKGLPQEDLDKVIVDFKMLGMDMGLNRYKLSPVANENGNISYQGKAILPVCVSGRVDWVATTQVISTDRIYEAVFEFKVSK